MTSTDLEKSGKGWQELIRNYGSRCPKLFYRWTASKEAGFELEFTDLLAVYTTQASVEEVCETAKMVHSPIDPSGSPCQLHVLLEKLEESLSTGTNTLMQDEDSGQYAILLTTVLDLKKPLQPLRWEFHLQERGVYELAETIMRPSLFEASAVKKKLEDLFSVISDKDHVISKLLEKIDGSSMDLSLIFPGISARSRKRVVTVKDAQARVPGLAQFRREEWQKRFESDSPYAKFETTGLSKLVAGCEKCPKHTAKQHQTWLLKLPKASATASQVARAQLSRSTTLDVPLTDSDSDEFETQKKRHPALVKDDETDVSTSGDEGPAMIPRQLSFKSRSPNGKYPSQLPNRSSSPILPPPLPKHKVETSSIVTSDSSSDLDAQPKARGRLGQVGLKAKPLPTRQAEEQHLPSSSPPPTRKLSAPRSMSPVKVPSLGAKPSRSSSSREPSTPRKLGRLPASKQKSRSVTPEKMTQVVMSTQNTPSRRLGRIGRSVSQNMSQSQHEDTDPSAGKYQVNELQPIEEHNDSGSDTASTASPPVGHSNAHRDSIPPTFHSESSRNVQSPQESHPSLERDASMLQNVSESEDKTTKEEKANRRREELKRKVAGVDGTIAGVRKKRKF